jgi:hypothetical protein
LVADASAGMLARVSDSKEWPIETWRPELGFWPWTITVLTLLGVWFAWVTWALVETVQGGDLFMAGVFAAMWLGGLAIFIDSARYRTSRLEIRRDGLTVVSLGHRRRIAWTQLARVEVEDIDFPSLRGRGPCVVLVLTDRRRVRLRVTEQWKWGYDKRVAALEQHADRLRAIRRECRASGGQPGDRAT